MGRAGRVGTGREGMSGGGSPPADLPGGGGALPPGRPGTVGAGREDGVGGGPRDTWGGGAVVFLMFPGDVCGWLYDEEAAGSQSDLSGGGAGVLIVAVDTSPMILSASLHA